MKSSTSLILFFGLVCQVSSRLGDTFGTNIHYTIGLDGETAMLSKAYRVARMDFDWGTIEKVCGEYNFTLYDRLLEDMEANGVRPYWILDYSNICYPSDPWPSCSTPACIAGYGAFAKAAAAHFKGHNILWESVNEPNGMGKDNADVISSLIKAAGEPLQAAGEIWLGPTTAGIDLSYLNATFSNGILSVLSAVSVHPYRAAAPEDALGDYFSLRQLLTLAGSPDFGVVAGEWGYTSALPPCVYGNKRDRVTQGKYVPRMWLTNMLAGTVLASINYDWKNDGTNVTDCESNFGSVDLPYLDNPSNPFSPKPSYRAALSIQTTIGNAAKMSNTVVPSSIAPNALALNVSASDVFILQFQGGTLPQNIGYALWTNVTTCSAPIETRTVCASPGANETECLTAGCCFDASAESPGCYSPPTIAETCPDIGPARKDCGYSGISKDICSSRGCCWDQNSGNNGPQCFFHATTGMFEVSFSVPSADSNTCFSTIDVFGFNREQVCASNGVINLNVTDGPMYLI